MDHTGGTDVAVAAMTDGTVIMTFEASRGLVVTLHVTARQAAELATTLANIAAVAHEIIERN